MRHLVIAIFSLLIVGCNDKTASQKLALKTESDWKQELTTEEFSVLRKSNTEKAFTGKYLNTETKGVYVCAGCGSNLFYSANKYHSGTGWPAFDSAIEGTVKLIADNSDGMQRIEVRCENCDGHLGHRFDDGPLDSTGKRFCINSVALKLNTKI